MILESLPLSLAGGWRVLRRLARLLASLLNLAGLTSADVPPCCAAGSHRHAGLGAVVAYPPGTPLAASGVGAQL